MPTALFATKCLWTCRLLFKWQLLRTEIIAQPRRLQARIINVIRVKTATTGNVSKVSHLLPTCWVFRGSRVRCLCNVHCTHICILRATLREEDTKKCLWNYCKYTHTPQVSNLEPEAPSARSPHSLLWQFITSRDLLSEQSGQCAHGFHTAKYANEKLYKAANSTIKCG